MEIQASAARSKHFKADMRPRRPGRRFGVHEKTWFQVQLITPAIIMLSAFEVIPMILGFITSLKNFRLYDLHHPFVGTANYAQVITDPLFYGIVLPNTFAFFLTSVGLQVTLGLSIAILINRPFKGEGLVRTILLLPMMVAPVASGLMFAWMFNDEFGIANVVLKGFGLSPVTWLSQQWTAFGVIILADVWTWTPFFIIILLAALRSLPPEPIEAAMVDGAGGWQIFRNITLPMISPVLLVSIVLRCFDAFRVFDVVWTITSGGPGRATEVFSIYSYKQAFRYMNFGMGSASSMLGALIVICIGLVFYKSISRALDKRPVNSA